MFRPSATHIQLRELPRSTLPADLRRLCIRERLPGVTDLALDYHRFLPTGRAYLTLAHADHLHSTIQALRNSSVASLPVHAVPSPPPQSNPGRTAQRNAFSGNGPRGGIHSRMAHVVVWGFPGRISDDAVADYLRRFALDSVHGQRTAVKVELPTNTFSLYSRYLVRPASTAEAYRLVRDVHMSFYQPGHWGKSYHLRARLVY